MKRRWCIVVGFPLCAAVTLGLGVCRLLELGPRGRTAATPDQLRARGTQVAVVTSADPDRSQAPDGAIPEIDARHALLVIALLVATRRNPLRRA